MLRCDLVRAVDDPFGFPLFRQNDGLPAFPLVPGLGCSDFGGCEWSLQEVPKDLVTPRPVLELMGLNQSIPNCLAVSPTIPFSLLS